MAKQYFTFFYFTITNYFNNNYNNRARNLILKINLVLNTHNYRTRCLDLNCCR